MGKRTTGITGERALLLLIICFLISIFILFFYGDEIRDYKMKKKASHVITLIEDYKQTHKTLPVSLGDLGYQNPSSPNNYFYDIIDDSTYCLSFMHSIDYNICYYSDEKKWRRGIR